VPNEGRSSYCGGIAAKISIYALLNSEVAGPVFTIFVHDVIVAINTHIYKATMHSVTERQSKK